MKKILFGSAIAAIFAYLFFMQLHAAWDFTIDDMFITLRYARHLIEGHGIIWNLGDAPLEGYSNFSYLVFAVVAMKLGLDPVFSLKMISAAFLLLSTVLLYCLSRMWLEAKFAVIPALWLLSYVGVILWTVSGLETPAYQCLILASCFFLFKGLGYRNYELTQHEPLTIGYFIAAGITLSLAGLTRPDAPAFMLTWFIALLWLFYGRAPKHHQAQKINALLAYCLTIGLLYGSYFLWRWHYFGMFFPNTVYCKWLNGFSPGALDSDYIKLILPLVIVALPYLIKVRDARKVFLIAPSIVYLILLYDSDGVVGFYNRHFIACLALLLPLPLLGVMYLSDKIRHKIPPWSHTLGVYLFAFYFALICLPGLSLAGYRYYLLNMQAGNEMRHQLVLWLADEVGEQSKIVASDCGVTGYLSNFHIIDSYCLNSREMTTFPLNGSYQRFVDWVLKKQKPSAIVITSLSLDGKSLYPPADKIFLKHSLFKQDYILKKIFSVSPSDGTYQYAIYLRKQ